MATKKKMLQAAAGQATGGAGLDITDVFSTYLYTGNGSTQTITNDIDLAGEGGLVWLKDRVNGNGHVLYDTERGAYPTAGFLVTNDTIAASTTLAEQYAQLTDFNTNGFTLGNATIADVINGSGGTYASWTFRKAPKFFDVVTYTGDGAGLRNIPHNLGVTPGFVIIKRTDASGDWGCGVLVNGVDQYEILKLNTTDTGKTQFGVGSATTFNVAVGSYNFDASIDSNINGATYVAYLFAHNDGDGEFGPDGDADIIKCGSYTGNGSTDGPEIDLGFEPQWVMIKSAGTAKPWLIFDTMRGIATGGADPFILANSSNAENDLNDFLSVTPTGFKLNTIGYGDTDQNGINYIYIAIRRGPLAPPESGTEVFSPDFATGYPRYATGFVTDYTIQALRDSGGKFAHTRLTGGGQLSTNSTDAEVSGSWDWAQMDGSGDNFTSTTRVGWNWRRAPNFFDVVAYTGNGTTRTVSHNLGVAPEMMIVKSRSATAGWMYYHKDAGNTKALWVDSSVFNPPEFHTDSGWWGNTTPSDTSFTLGINTNVNASSFTYIAYLFASLDGVSKVGSYTGNGTSQTIDCGFTSGARFILIFREDAASDIYVWDTERGIVTGNDPYLQLNTSDAEVTSTDWVDPDSSGFIVNGTTINASGGNYLFYAIS